MAKRQVPDLSQLLTTTAVPMLDAARSQPQIPAIDRPNAAPAPEKPIPTTKAKASPETATPYLENLNFKVPKSFRKRFRDCAYKADLKHNELLFAALDAWERINEKTN